MNFLNIKFFPSTLNFGNIKVKKACILCLLFSPQAPSSLCLCGSYWAAPVI